MILMAKTNFHTRAGREQGFTLLELLITVAVAAVLAAVALPNMSIFIQNNARSTNMNGLTTAFNIARSEAVTKQITTTVCASTTTPTPVAYTCNGTNQFEDGYIVMLDADADGNVDPGDVVLRISEPDMGSATLRGRDSLNVAVTRVSFDSTGQTTGLSANGGVRFTYCDSRVLSPASPAEPGGATTIRATIMTFTGHAKTSRDGADADEIHEVRGVNIGTALSPGCL